MMEKQNRTIEKGAAGDAGALDDIVDFASAKMEKARTVAAPHRRRGIALVAEKCEAPAQARSR